MSDKAENHVRNWCLTFKKPLDQNALDDILSHSWVIKTLLAQGLLELNAMIDINFEVHDSHPLKACSHL